VFIWGFGVLFLSCVCVSGVVFSVGVCVCDLLIFLHTLKMSLDRSGRLKRNEGAVGLVTHTHVYIHTYIHTHILYIYIYMGCGSALFRQTKKESEQIWSLETQEARWALLHTHTYTHTHYIYMYMGCESAFVQTDYKGVGTDLVA